MPLKKGSSTTKPPNKRTSMQRKPPDPNTSLSDVSEDEYATKEKTDKLAAISAKMNTQLKQQKLHVQKLLESYDFMSSNFDKLNDEIKKLREENKKLRSDVNKLQKNEANMNKRIGALESELIKSKQDSNSNHMVITNLPHFSKETNIKTVVAQIATQVAYELQPDEVIEAFQINNTKKGTYPVIVKLKSNGFKSKCMQYRKQKQHIDLKTIDAHLHNGGKNINFYHYIEKEYAALLNKAKSIAKEKGYKFVWFSESTVLVRRDEKSNIIKIKCDADIQSIK